MDRTKGEDFNTSVRLSTNDIVKSKPRHHLTCDVVYDSSNGPDLPPYDKDIHPHLRTRVLKESSHLGSQAADCAGMEADSHSLLVVIIHRYAASVCESTWCTLHS